MRSALFGDVSRQPIGPYLTLEEGTDWLLHTTFLRCAKPQKGDDLKLNIVQNKNWI